ncbi:MAG: N-acetylmuramoyl-L-alanine amidase [Actinobacteria bacterium]|nr:N-acetylmuramoyl-L-alanine amidase [Actinomycetota bacterium]
MVVSSVMFSESAVALTAPETLADRRPVQAGPVEPGFPIDYLGVLWASAPGDDHGDDDRGAEPHGAVRFRHQGAWGPWVPLIEDGAAGPGDGDQWGSGLVAGDDAEAYQVRGVPAAAGGPQAVAINTTDGPRVAVGEARRGTAAAMASADCRSRADWGADESLRFGADGAETWPPAHYPVQVATVHHTATKNDDADPEATVRAIYRYHAVDNGWGDIGYQYLIDESGVVYEGRWSGTKSTSCELEGGDASDFAHETTDLDGDGVLDEMTTAAHTGGANSGNLGVALLGEFTDHPRTGGEPKAAAVTALEDVLAEVGHRHALDPTGEVLYVNPVNGDQRRVDTISGHRDWAATECPGENLFGQLPAIRTNVAAKMAASDADSAPAVSLSSPADGSTVSGTDVAVAATASDDDAVVQVEFLLDGSRLAVDTDAVDGWATTWNSSEADDGPHTLEAVATDTVGQTASAGISVTVDNSSGAGSSTPVHVGDLDGSAVAAKNQWYASVAVTVVDGAGAPVADAKVDGTWTTSGSTASCTTDGSGTCTVASQRVRKSTDALTFQVDAVTHAALSYEPGANTDPDGDSDGTTITVKKPA